MSERKTGCEETARGPLKTVGENLIQFSDGLADGGILQNLFLFQTARNESGGANAVNLAGDAAGILKNALESIIAKRGTGKKTGNVQMMVNIINGLLEIQGWNLVSIGESLAKSLMDGEMEGLVQNGRSHQEQGTQRTAVHIGRKQETELLEGERRKEMSLVNDEQGVALFGADEFIEGGADAGSPFSVWKRGAHSRGQRECHERGRSCPKWDWKDR